jgi:hypothetical protein
VPEPPDYSAEVQAILAELGLEPVLIGALAAMAYRRTPRATTDVDFLVRSVSGLVERLRELGYDVSEMREGDEEPYVVFARSGGRRIEVLRAETAYQRVAIGRAIDGVLAPEDVIVHKLIAWRRGVERYSGAGPGKSSRRVRLRIFPDGLRGITSTNMAAFGSL